MIRLQDLTGERGALREAYDSLRQHLVAVMLFSAAVNVLYLAPSLYMLQVYDRVLLSGSQITLFFLTVALFVALLVLALLDETRAGILARGAIRLERRLGPLVMRASLGEGNSPRPRMSIGLRDLDTVKQAAGGAPILALLDAPWAPIYLLVCFVIHPVIGGVVLIGCIVLAFLALANEQASRKGLEATIRDTQIAYSVLEGDQQAADAARALGMQSAIVARHTRERERLASAQTRLAFTGSRYSALIKFVRLFWQSLVLGAGALLAIDQLISPGQLIAGTVLATRAFAPIEQVVGSWRMLAQALVAMKSLRTLLDRPVDDVEPTRLPNPKGDLRLENVTVTLPGQDRPTVANVSLRIGPGEVIGVIGNSGAGKSTLARLAAGALTPDQGVVRIDGADMRQWDPELLGPHIGYLPQDVGLLTGTVADNISRLRRYLGQAMEELSPHIVQAAKAAGAHDMILKLRAGYDSPIGPGGRGVSAGQAQRIGLARAFFGAPSVLILDEPNAHLDNEGEAALVQALEGARKAGAAILVVSHRPGLLNITDKILVMRDGRAEMFGPRAEVFARMARAQGVRPAIAPGQNAPTPVATPPDADASSGMQA